MVLRAAKTLDVLIFFKKKSLVRCLKLTLPGVTSFLPDNVPGLKKNYKMCSVKKGILKNFAKFKGKCLFGVYFSVSLPKFLRTPFLQNTGRLLLIA